MTYPGIARACLLIALDSGGINRDRSERKQASDFKRWIARQDGPLVEIDTWLAGLTDDELEIVCCGGQGEPEQVALMAHAPAFADDLLDAYFDEVC